MPERLACKVHYVNTVTPLFELSRGLGWTHQAFCWTRSKFLKSYPGSPFYSTRKDERLSSKLLKRQKRLFGVVVDCKKTKVLSRTRR